MVLLKNYGNDIKTPIGNNYYLRIKNGDFLYIVIKKQQYRMKYLHINNTINHDINQSKITNVKTTEGFIFIDSHLIILY